MKLAKVIGQVVATVRSEHLCTDKLALVQFINQIGDEIEAVGVAVDKLGAGEGEWVLVVAGSSARMSVDGGGHVPVDLSIVAIVDEVTGQGNSWFQKNLQD